MSERGGLTVLSTRADDILVRPDGALISESEGGPMHFIEQALTDAGVVFESHEAPRMRVEIEVHDNGEYGRIHQPSVYRYLGEVGVMRWCIVSTLLDEWVLDGAMPDRMFVDIQGYVRDGSAFGKKRPWPLDSATTQAIFCLKGTEEEISYLPREIVEAQKRSRMLVVTRGDQGVTIYDRGHEYSLSAQVVDDLPDTVGAGDTFFAYFTAALYKRKSQQEAGEFATQRTAQFLLKKTR